MCINELHNPAYKNESSPTLKGWAQELDNIQQKLDICFNNSTHNKILTNLDKSSIMSCNENYKSLDMIVHNRNTLWSKIIRR